MKARIRIVAMVLVASGAAVALGERELDAHLRKGPDGKPRILADGQAA